MKSRRFLQFASVVFLAAFIDESLCVQPASAQAASNTSVEALFASIVNDFSANLAQEDQQPDWVAPLIATASTPGLDQQLRYDQWWEGNPNGAATDIFGGGKGLGGNGPGGDSPVGIAFDLMFPFKFPKDTYWSLLNATEVVLGVPAWMAHNGTQRATKNTPPVTDGWADETFWLKYRIYAKPQYCGNRIVTALMNFSAPTGTGGNSSRHGIFTPMIALGQGWGGFPATDDKDKCCADSYDKDKCAERYKWGHPHKGGEFDVQTSAGISLPDGGLQRLGMPVAWNTAFQWQVLRHIWPEFEVNYTWWPNGMKGRETQVFLTPGVILEKIPCIGVTLGVGYQVAVTDSPAYNHNVVFSTRLPFPPKWPDTCPLF